MMRGIQGRDRSWYTLVYVTHILLKQKNDADKASLQ